MGRKLQRFLGALGGALNKDVFAANQQQYAMEAQQEAQAQAAAKVEQSRIDDNNLKIATADVASKLAILKQMGPDNPAAKKLVLEMKEIGKTVAPQYHKAFMGTVGDSLAGVIGLDRKPVKGESFAAIDEKGNPVMAIENDKGQIVDSVNFKHQPKWTKAPTKAETGGPGDFTKKTDSEIQKQLLSGKLGKDRLKVIKDDFQEKFTQAWPRFKAKITAGAEILGLPVDKASKKELADMTSFSRNSLANLNQHIRDRTGAVMNLNETGRLKGEMPNIGEGIFDSDSATKFMSKLEGAFKTLEAAEDRLLYVRANGLGEDPEEFSKSIPLGEFRDLPSAPPKVDTVLWNKMAPSDRREYIKLLNAKGRQ